MNYLSITDLVNKLHKKAKKLENGKLTTANLEAMLEESREIYERITVLRYKALIEDIEEEVSVVEEPIPVFETPKEENTMEEVVEEIALNFSIPTKEDSDSIPANQKNLLDEIQEIDDIKTSVNDQFSSSKELTLAEKLNKSKIEDLRSVIGLNQKFLFMNDLFQGEKEFYDKTLDKLNECNSFEEATIYLKEEVEEIYDWALDSKSVIDFKKLIGRKF